MTLGKQNMLRRNSPVIVVIIVMGILLLTLATDSFKAFTAEQARRVTIVKQTPQLPDFTFEDSNSEVFQLSDLRGKYILATYFYTRCGDVLSSCRKELRRNFH